MDEILRKKIGQRVKKIRKEKGLTQNEMVSHFKCGRSNYSKMESGQIMPGASLMAILHTKFKVSLDWLITGEGTMYYDAHKHLDFGDYSADVKELLENIAQDKAIKHAVLSYYYSYKADGKKALESLEEKNSQRGT